MIRSLRFVRAIGGRGLVALLIACAGILRSAPARADDRPRLDESALRNGNAAFPFVWKPYRPPFLPPVDLRNGAQLVKHLADGKLQLSQRDFLQLVVENDLDLLGARYNFAIAQVDILRARSGQAARGVASAPLPASVFAGAIGAGVSTTVPLSAGGTGGAAISTQGKLVTIGPRGVFDPTLNLNLSYDRLVNPLNTTRVAGVSAVTVPSTVLQTRLQQELPEGTSYSISFNLQRQTSTQAGLLFNPALTSFGALQIYQPLLNGFGLPLTQRFVTLAQNNTKIVTEAFHSMLNDTLSNAANAYWDLVALRENRRAAADAVAAAEQQRDENLERVDLGVMTPLDVLTAESQLAASRVQLVQAQTAVEQQEVVLKTFISKQIEPALDALTIEPTESLPGPTEIEVPSTDVSIATALASRSSIRQAQLSLQNQRIAQEYTRKNLLPVFSVYAAVDMYGLAPGTPPAIRQLVRLAYPEYSVGLTWSLPLFNRAAVADDVRARLESQESEVSLQRTRQQVTMQVQNATTSVAQNRARVSAAGRALVASRTVYEGEQDRLRAGMSTPYRVLLALRDLTAAQSADVQARVNYAKALVAYQVAVGSLLEHNGIDADTAQRGNLWSSHP
jgi:outer membrane protein TolC